MEIKEKAEALIKGYEKILLSKEYQIHGLLIRKLSKQCALMAVEEITNNEMFRESKYWAKVKNEIILFGLNKT